MARVLAGLDRLKAGEVFSPRHLLRAGAADRPGRPARVSNPGPAGTARIISRPGSAGERLKQPRGAGLVRRGYRFGLAPLVALPGRDVRTGTESDGEEIPVVLVPEFFSSPTSMNRCHPTWIPRRLSGPGRSGRDAVGGSTPESS